MKPELIDEVYKAKNRLQEIAHQWTGYDFNIEIEKESRHFMRIKSFVNKDRGRRVCVFKIKVHHKEGVRRIDMEIPDDHPGDAAEMIKEYIEEAM